MRKPIQGLTALLGLCVVVASPGCESTYSHKLTISFQESSVRAETESLTLWAMDPDMGACDALMGGDVSPADAAVFHRQHQADLDHGSWVFPDVPAGHVLFFAEGSDQAGDMIVRGCSMLQIVDDDDVDIAVQLIRRPEVVSTVPANLASGLASGIHPLTVEFSQDMRSGVSICTSDQGELPDVAGDPQWTDLKTWTAPINMANGTKYAYGVNCADFTNFRNTAGIPAHPMTIVFETGP